MLVPIEHLAPGGMSPEFARLVRARCGWSPEVVACFDEGFVRYWERSAALAHRATTWPPPRRRHVAVVRDALAVRPYVALLNTSAWTLYEVDLDPERSHPEFVAYLLVHGEWVALTGEVSLAAVRGATWWLERTDDECEAFAQAARRSVRPDAALWQAIAGALPWLRRLSHDTIRPPVLAVPARPIPGTGLRVPRPLEHEPANLAVACAQRAEAALSAYRTRWCRPDAAVVSALLEWLRSDRPPLVVTEADGRPVWAPDAPDRTAPLATRLATADAVAVESIHADLDVIARVSRAFFEAVVDPAGLPSPTTDLSQSGYNYLHRERRLIAYNLDEPGMERLHGPPLPYAREMLGARTAHEWGHLADAAGWIVRTTSDDTHARWRDELAAALDDAVGAAPASLRRLAAPDVAALAPAGVTPGRALADLALKRLPDWRTNLVARAFMTPAQRETYARHNIRTLRGLYTPSQVWRMLVRYLYEYQYLLPPLRLSAVRNPRDFFVHSTWFADDFFATGALTPERFDLLAASLNRLCACHRVDERALRVPAASAG